MIGRLLNTASRLVDLATAVTVQTAVGVLDLWSEEPIVEDEQDQN